MAPKYILTYFKTKGLAESIRLLLAYGNQEFEENYIDNDKWQQIKSNFPFGKVPVLEVDGKVYHQSKAICRYLGKKFGLAGSNDEESLQIDMIVDTFDDWTTELKTYFNTQNEEEKAKVKNKIVTETIPYYASKFEEIVKTNGGYFVNGKLTWADIRFVTVVGGINSTLGTDMLEPYPNLKSLQKKVFEEPNIKAWLRRREPI